MKSKNRFKKNYEAFKECTRCGFKWTSRDQFLADPGVELVGYQVNFVALLAGFFLFNHSCGTTFSVYTEAFEDLYDGPVFSERSTGSEKCPEHCIHEDDLSQCPAQCECAFVREIIQRIKRWPKCETV